MYDVVVGKTTESDRQANPTTYPNPKPYLVAVHVVLPRRKESSRSLSHLLMSFLFYLCLRMNVLIAFLIKPSAAKLQ